jgi:hypothetical protein
MVDDGLTVEGHIGGFENRPDCDTSGGGARATKVNDDATRTDASSSFMAATKCTAAVRASNVRAAGHAARECCAFPG